MKLLLKILIICLIIIATGEGCHKTNVKDADLINTIWVLNYIQSTKTLVKTDFPNKVAKEISIEFSDSQSTISFSGICNGGSGTYSLTSLPGEIKITDLVTTKIACQYVEWEGYATQSLDNSISYNISGNNLVIYTSGDYNLYFIKR